jgi:signal transduction histidine kinase
MAARLGSLIGAQRSFVADASHELRTPLTALRLRIENLEFAQPEELPHEVDVLSSEVSRLARLVEGLLALARAEGQRPEREVIALDTEVAQRIEAWEAFAAEQEVTITRPAPSRAEVQVVRGSFSQMLDNFLANALEVSPPSSTIDVKIVTNHHFASVHVIDEGPGMGDHEQARAFDRFWRAPSSSPGRGSGLGLAIVRQLAEASGGNARLSSAPSGGIDACVSLPLSDNRNGK